MNANQFLTAAIRLIVEQELDAALSRRGLAALTEDTSRDAWRHKTALRAIHVVARHYGMSPEKLLGPGRAQPAAEARQIAVVILRRLARFTRAEAVHAVGRGDPTTYWNCEGRVSFLASTDGGFRDRLAHLAATAIPNVDRDALQTFRERFALQPQLSEQP